MTNAGNELERIHERIDALQRQNRTLKRLGVLALGLFIGVPSMAWAWQERAKASKPGVVTASKFVLTDAAGKARGELMLKNDSPGLFLTDAEGKQRVKLYIDKNQAAFFVLADHKGNTHVGLASDAGGLPHLILNDEHQKPRAHMAVSPTGAPSLLFIDTEGNMPAGLGIHVKKDAKDEAWLRPAHPKGEHRGEKHK